MIIGIGTDLVDIQRIWTILKKESGRKLMERILTPKEIELAEEGKGQTAQFTAGRFAAKEAIVKALGCGIGELAGFMDIEILPDEKGKPVCTLSDKAKKRLGLGSDVRIHISITHTDELAAAYAVVEKRSA
ncbi:holo-ACP synthase [Paenibacillus larvae]|uniref:holo-ACP synthase n=1 Tax=Paenibacillus larvae TaxID=1464 RepID=UPI00227EC488|nr:holo-ACP synthase [Paenibacillus larvae]MCY9509351.1 holo-ACP synthase [Paenibacillus larvae]MCY9526145.1 holo-ACP synthase [Paenibacillus larvae]